MPKLRRYLSVIVWCIIIFGLSSLQTTPTPKDTILNFVIKKTAHIIEYAILYLLTFRAMNHDQIRSPKNKLSLKSYLYPLIFTILYAITDEIHQSFVPGRHARTYDIGFDALGAFTTIYIIYRSVNKSDKKTKF